MELPERKGNKCQFGARCTNHKCTLEHPTGSSDNTGTRLSPSEEEKKDTVPTLSEMNPMQQQQEHTNPSALGPHHMRLKTKTSESMKRMFQTMTGGGNVHKKALQTHDYNNPKLSCRSRAVGAIRFVLAFFFLQAFFFGLAIAVAVVLSIAFMVVRNQRGDRADITVATVVWTVATPWIMIVFAELTETAFLLMLSAAQNSPRQVMNSHDFNARYEFIYTVSGGESPLLLHYRANVIAIVAAAFVPIQTIKVPVCFDSEPMFPVPDWCILISEVLFVLQFVVYPAFYSLSGFGLRYTFFSSPQAFVTVMLLDCLVTVVIQCLMNTIVFFWPRAARIRAFITGHSIAMHAFAPYVEDVSNRPVVRTLANNRTCCCCSGTIIRSGVKKKNEDSPAVSITEKTEIKINDGNSNNSNNSNEHQENAIDIMETQWKTDCFSVTEFDAQQFSFYDPDKNNDEFASLLALNKVMRLSYYSSIGPRWWFALGSPTDLLWERCCSHMTIGQLCCRFCCVNRRWNSEKATNPTNPIANDDINMKIDSTNKLSFVRGKMKRGSHNHNLHSSSTHSSATEAAVQLQDEQLMSCAALCENMSYKWEFALTFWLYVIMLCISFVPGLYVSAQLLMALTVLALGKSLRHVAPSIFGRLFFALLALQVTIQFFVLGLAYNNQTSKAFVEQNVTFTGWNASFDSDTDSNNKWPAPKYRSLPICDVRFGSKKYVSILDIGVLIASVYDTTEDYGAAAVQNIFAGGPLEDAILNTTVVQKKGQSDITWQRWDLPNAKTSVFVVRGTLTTYDALQDLAIYALSSSIEILSFGLSLDAIIPDGVITDLIDIISNDDFQIKTHMKLSDTIASFKRTHPKNEWTTIVAGHSLGGSYANILSAKHEIPSVSFSPPGLLYISKSLGIKKEQLELAKSFATSFVPEWDLVAKVDHIVGTRVEIPCTAKLNSSSDISLCHAPMRTLSTLVMACPDDTHPTRRWKIAEDFYGEEKKIWYLGGPGLDHVAWPYKWREEAQ